RQIGFRVRGVLGKRHSDRALDEELQTHLVLLIEQNMERGMSPEAARREAKLSLGGADQIKESVHDHRGLPFLDSLAQDVRFALRMLRKNPGFTIVAVLTLALGIGASTAIFSLIDAVMLRSLPVRNPQQLLILHWTAVNQPTTRSSYDWSSCPGVSDDPTAPPHGCTFSFPMFDQLRARQDIFSDICAFIAAPQKHLTTSGSVSMANGFLVSGDFFATLRTRAILGRTLDPADDEPTAKPVVMLSYAFWRSRFGGDPSIVGKSILVEKTPFTVIGIVAPGFAGLNPGLPDDLWMPLSSQSSVAPYFPKRTAANSLWLEMMARLRPGVSMSQAQSALSVIFAASTTSGSSAMFKPNDAPRIELTSAAHGLTSLRHEFSQPLFFLMASVGIILLIACANVGGLSLARASSRRQEFAMRFTLGATRIRLMRQLLTESLLTSLLGAALGILLAYWSASALAAFLSANWFLPIDVDVRPDRMVLAFTIAVAVLAAILFGLAPALQGARVDLAPALKGGSNTSNFAARRLSFGSLLVVAQVALSIVVLAGAGLLVRTLVNLQQMKAGFETDHLLLFSVDMTMAGYSTFGDDARVFQLDRSLQARLAALPGVTSVSYSMVSLLSGGYMTSDFKFPDAPLSSSFSGDELPVGPDFFETMRIPLLSGRTFTAADFQSSAKPKPAIINQSFAKRLFGNENPLGRGISEGDSKTAQWQVIGVAADAKYDSLRKAIAPTVYTMEKHGGAEFELRTKANPKVLIPLVRDAVNRVNSSLLLSDFKTQDEQIDQLLYQERLVAGLSSLFGVLALVLACIGLYGLLAYEVARRTREIGIRMALGAQRDAVLRLFVRKGIALTIMGAGIGLAVAAGATRFLQSLLYAVKPTDPFTFIGVAIVLLAVALLACYIPARRAMKVDPMVALRYE
ncbi:MAG: ABC transporter permease, partial [Candidatus Acidiferrales bacterium]